MPTLLAVITASQYSLASDTETNRGLFWTGALYYIYILISTLLELYCICVPTAPYQNWLESSASLCFHAQSTFLRPIITSALSWALPRRPPLLPRFWLIVLYLGVTTASPYDGAHHPYPWLLTTAVLFLTQYSIILWFEHSPYFPPNTLRTYYDK